MKKILKNFENVIVITLLALMMLAVFLSAVEMAIILYQQIIAPPVLLLNIDEMLKVFGFFLMVLIGLELLESIKTYLEDNRVHAEIVFLVAIVAVSRKVIILDYKNTDPEMLYGMAAIIVALGIGYFLVRKALCLNSSSKDSDG